VSVRILLVFASLLALGACKAADPPVRSLAGEIHLHQYGDGAHLSALFIDPATPIERTSFDSALPAAPPSLYDRNGCTAFLLSECDNNGCPVPPPIDVGPVAVEGLPMPIDFKYDQQLEGYDDYTIIGPFLPPGAEPEIHASGSARFPAFSGSVKIPAEFNPSSTLMQGTSAGLEVSWTPSRDGSEVRVLVSVLPTMGTGAVASCQVDEALGQYRVPDDLMALLPPPPRQVQLELSRYRLANLPLGDGRAVVVHGGYSVLSAVTE
jgi:hypothetical protein